MTTLLDKQATRDEMLGPWDIGRNRYLLDDELAHVFGQKADGVRLFVISDSCHSGSVSRFAPSPSSAVALQQPRPRFLPPLAFVKDKSLRKRIAIVAGLGNDLKVTRQVYPALLLAGCQDTEFSYDATIDGRPNGAFTHVVLAAMERNPKCRAPG